MPLLGDVTAVDELRVPVLLREMLRDRVQVAELLLPAVLVLAATAHAVTLARSRLRPLHCLKRVLFKRDLSSFQQEVSKKKAGYWSSYRSLRRRVTFVGPCRMRNAIVRSFVGRSRAMLLRFDFGLAVGRVPKNQEGHDKLFKKTGRFSCYNSTPTAGCSNRRI